MSDEPPQHPRLQRPLATAKPPYFKATQTPLMMLAEGNPMRPKIPTPFPGAAMQAPQLPAIPPIRSLQDALEKARKDLAKPAVTVRDVMQLLQKTLGVSKTMFGGNAALTHFLAAEMMAASKLAATKQDFRALFEQQLNHAEQLFRQLTVLAEVGQTGTRSFPSATPLTKKVFIVHGHDNTNWLLMRQILTEPPYKGYGIEPIVIREQAGQSKPILQKFEDAAAESSYAICIFTPDDLVQVRIDGKSHYQARPNVIFETGWFVGRLGPSRVLLLVKNGTQLHSDFDGVSKVPFAESIEEQMTQINRELVAAGLIV